jgi:hypothetical protein
VPAVREGGDAGLPIVVADPGHPVSGMFAVLAGRVTEAVERADAAAAAVPA